MSQLIANLTAASPIATTDLMIIEQAGGTRKTPISQLIATFVGNAWTLLTTGANATVPVYAGLAANGVGASSYANIDIALTPKGTGALMASTPDNIITGGNKRGTYAVDWQMRRTLALQVASGVGSTICGGENNAAAGIDSFVGGGSGNSSGVGSYSTVVGGQSNTGLDGFSFIGGGRNNQMQTASQDAVIAGGNSNVIFNAQSAFIGGGTNNRVDGLNSWIPCGNNGTTRLAYSSWAYSGGAFSVQGDAQWREGIFRKQTADATPANIHLDGGVSDINSANLAMPINSAQSFVIELVAKSAANKSAFFELRGLLQTGATLATAALVGAPSGTVALFIDAALTGIAVAITANTSIGGINLTVTGLAATSIKWVARMRTVEVVG